MSRGLRTSARPVVVALMSMVLLAAGCSDEGAQRRFGPPGDIVDPSAFDPQPTTPETPLEPGEALTPVGRWIPTDYFALEGYFTNIFGSDPAWFEFGGTGTIEGFTGCGTISGQFRTVGAYTAFGTTLTTDDDGQAIEITILDDDPTACDEGFAREQHRDLIANLEGAARWVELDGGTVIIRNQDTTNTIVSTRAG